MKNLNLRMTSALKRCMSALAATGLLFTSACNTAPGTGQRTPPTPAAPPAEAKVPERKSTPNIKTSMARSSKEYRKDAAEHLYSLNASRIYSGRMPALLEAVGVLNINIDQKGDVKSIDWMRAPKHMPKVMAEIERIVRAAAPYPVPRNMSRVTYTDTWLWDTSGKFQLDTLTEGQN